MNIDCLILIAEKIIDPDDIKDYYDTREIYRNLLNFCIAFDIIENSYIQYLLKIANTNMKLKEFYDNIFSNPPSMYNKNGIKYKSLELGYRKLNIKYNILPFNLKNDERIIFTMNYIHWDFGEYINSM
jgi:hypothetical protein